MNIVVIFAGGTGQRMSTVSKPKQFLELHGKPIIGYTVEHFEKHPDVDGIIIVCLESWIPACRELMEKLHIRKVMDIIPGGTTGQESIYFGVKRAHELCPPDSVVLIHDGVRPLITAELISSCISCTRQNGNAITVSPVVETVVIKESSDGDSPIREIADRSLCETAKAPQCFILQDLLSAHEQARARGELNYIDSANLMKAYGHKLHRVQGSSENIKITTPIDFYIFRAIMDAKENLQIMGI
ncbi:2-C-methyl-D-erythritol 4-phosphate cytidylyltransferase [Anaerovibrio lipolyticus]|uniref:IspD/TarI family cytidylyltransferase n=1 Tax=Anaerovibrio lipolyticus TaxID=82374 RepID=UPI0026EC12A9|nr:IspD/TarI family cytidylyltransferase [Anaerovibrio lipolyticus]MBE6105102.1 2-C-methyl-D-erythritol 4-phosphate cytidylyltransferase [Anaerovibrio lipolyticus]